MLELNRHLKASGILDDDSIERRLSAIKKIAARIRRRTAAKDLLRTAHEALKALTESILTPDEVTALTKVFEQTVPSLVVDEKSMHEVSLLFVLGFSEAINVGPNVEKTSMPFLASAAYSGLEYLEPLQDPAREDLRKELMALARKTSVISKDRTRDEISEVTEDNALAAIEVLARNAVRDREEIDLLWWVINDWSQLTEKRISEMDPDEAAVISALEATAIMCDAGQRAHKEIAAKHITGNLDQKGPDEFAKASAETRPLALRVLADAKDLIQANGSIFPALAITLMGEEDKDLPPSSIGGHAYSPFDWCRRLVDELGHLRQVGHTPKIPIA